MLEPRFCSLCASKIRNREDSISYQVSICHSCIQNDERCLALKRAKNNLRKKVYYSKNLQQERDRAKKLYYARKLG